MTEPCSTGIGGDMFCLFYSAATGKISALNGSGRSGAKCTLSQIRADLGLGDGVAGKIPMTSIHAVTVPGAAAGWVDTVERFGSGKLSLAQILAPAIELGEKGFPVSEFVGEYVCPLINMRRVTCERSDDLVWRPRNDDITTLFLGEFVPDLGLDSLARLACRRLLSN